MTASNRPTDWLRDLMVGAPVGALLGFGLPFGAVLLLFGGMDGDGGWNGVAAVGFGTIGAGLGLVAGAVGWPLWRRRRRRGPD